MKEHPSGYALMHSTTIAQEANDPQNWHRSSDLYSRSSSISSASYYPSSNVDTEDDDDEDSVVITEYESERERTPMPFMRPLIQERSPPAVAMAVKTSVSQRPKRSQTQVIQTPPRPASRAGFRSRTGFNGLRILYILAHSNAFLS